jgi:NAD(P)H-dependent FMN reductase
MNHPIELVVILGTAREGNRSQKVVPGIVEAAIDRDWKTTVIEASDHPQSATDSHAGDEPFRSQMATADAFVIIAPEYNHSFPGELKMLLDRQQGEFAHKPVGLVGVSAGDHGGIRGVEGLLPVLYTLRAIAVLPQVLIGGIHELDHPFDVERHARQLGAMFGELAFYAEALKAARS